MVNIAKVMQDMGKIVSNLKIGESRPLSPREKAAHVVMNCKHTTNKKAACADCVANAIMQYEVYAAKVQKDFDCAVLCPDCKKDPETIHTIGHPRTHHRHFLKKRRLGKQDWRDVRCLAAGLHAAWDRVRQ